MTQKTSGVLSLLSLSGIYNFLQVIFKDNRPGFTLEDILSKYIKPSDLKILDVACGTGAVRGAIKERVEYHGYDISEKYIATASSLYTDESTFFVAKEFSETESLRFVSYFDVAFIVGGLHHMSDEVAINLLFNISRSLKPDGYLVTIDPVFVNDQSFLAKRIISFDRGQAVRTPDGYKSLMRDFFSKCDGFVMHRKPIPWTHWVMECKK